MTKAICATAAFLIALSAMSLAPPMAMAQSTIPGLSQIPNDFGRDERTRFTARRQALQLRLGVFQAAAKAFNAKSAEAQTDAEFAALQTQRAAYIQAASAFNRDLAAAEAREQPNLDTRVVDAQKVPSGLPKSVDHAIASGYASAPSGVSDRVRKGFQAIAAHDWKVARAWFEDALNHDPKNVGLKRLVELADYTEKRREREIAAKTGKSTSAASAVQLPKSSDMQYLFSEEKRHPAQSGTARQLPKDSDIDFLFPGLPALEAKELYEYTDQHWLKTIENDPQLINAGNPPRSK